MDKNIIKAIILGCGSSGGVPRVTGEWGVCNPLNPKNYRTRCSLALQYNGHTIIIDTSPDFRTQVLRERITSVSAVLYTHDHADQVHGIDDVRCFTQMGRSPILTFADDVTANILFQRFDYIFYQKPESDYPILMHLNRFKAFEPLIIDVPELKNIQITPFPAPHGKITAYGFIIGKMAYSPDVNFLAPQTLEKLKNLDIWVVDCLRYRPHDTHAHLDMVFEWYQQTKPKKMILTNLHIDMDYDTLLQELPENIIPAFDGISFDVKF